jgi:hypothetical protein
MGIFSKSAPAAPEPAPVKTGTEQLRMACKNWASHAGLPAIVREIPGLGLGTLEDFALRGGALTSAQLVAVAAVVWAGHRTYDPASDRCVISATAP